MERNIDGGNGINYYNTAASPELAAASNPPPEPLDPLQIVPARKLRDLTVGDRHKLTAEVLRLVYGNTDATRASVARFSVTCVARHLHLSPLLIKSVLRSHFYR